MWWKAETASLSPISSRLSTIYVEHAIVGRDSNGIVLYENDGETQVPATTIACILLGPGTRITHGAVRLLADSGTTLCWTGENGVRTYAHGVSTSHTSRYLVRQAALVSDPKRRLDVARAMYAMRFPGEDIARLGMQQLRGREGARVRRTYRLHASRTGVAWEGRHYVPGQPFAKGDDVNRLLSALNSCLYGVCHAAIAGVGASPALGFVHVGSAISFVLDIADLYKAQTCIPAAFDLAAAGAVTERDARLRFRDLVVEQGLMAAVVRDLHGLLFGQEAATTGGSVEDRVEDDRAPLADLWDEELGAVSGGRNYARDENTAVDYSAVDDL